MNKLLGILKRIFRRPFEMHKDMKLECAECGGTFRFEWGEQQFFKSRGLTPPKRCPDCRSGGRRRRGGKGDRGPSQGQPPRDGRNDRFDGRRDEGRDRNGDDRGHSRYIDDRPFYGEEGRDRGRRRRR